MERAGREPGVRQRFGTWMMGRLEGWFGGPARARVIVLLGAVLALSSADASTVGASAATLRKALHVSNFDIGLLVAVNSLMAAVASVPFGVLADRMKRTRLLGLSIILWGVCMLWSATVSSFSDLLLTRLLLGVATASAGPVVASMIGDWFPGDERGRIYSYVLTGELIGAGLGFAVTGDITALSWRAGFIVLALPAFALAVAILRLPEPVRGNRAPIADGMRTIPTQAYVAAPDDASGGQPDETDAQRLSRELGVQPDPDQVLRGDPSRLGIIEATRHILSIRTNVVMIVASAGGYFYLSGVQTFGTELAHDQYGINQAVANLVLLILGAGAVVGVLAGGWFGDRLLRRGMITGRLRVAWVAAVIAAVAFIPALATHKVLHAIPFLMLAALGLSGQNPPLDAARLDIMPAGLWGRAEGVRTLLRTLAQSIAPPLFGFVADVIFGGGKGALRWTFLIMLIPLAINAIWLFRAARTYPRDVATAAATSSR
jgi:MFS family permease